MPDQRHEELAAYLLGRLDEAEAARFRDHLAGCERCRAEEVELREVIGLLQRTIPSLLPADLEARTLAAVAAAHREPVAAAPPARIPEPSPAGRRLPAVRCPAQPSPSRRRLPPPGPTSSQPAGSAAAARAWSPRGGGRRRADGRVRPRDGRRGGHDDDRRQGHDGHLPKTVTVPDTALPGAEEKTATLDGDGFQAAARVNVIGPGRLVAVKSRTVPKIPKGTYYELRFVGPGDSPQTPNRISAGTWHPDKLGVTDVRFLIAADPKKFPDIEVTREPPDGDPRPSGRVVLESA